MARIIGFALASAALGLAGILGVPLSRATAAEQAGGQQTPPSSGDPLVDNAREDTAVKRAQNAALEARTKELEAQAAANEARLKEVDACFALMKTQLLAYRNTHTPEETKAKAEYVISKYKVFAATPGLTCPVSEGQSL